MSEPRDQFIIHPADRATYAPCFAERQDRVRAGIADPFEVIEDPTRLEHEIVCMRYSDDRTHYAIAHRVIDPSSLHTNAAPRIIGMELHFLSYQVRTMLGRAMAHARLQDGYDSPDRRRSHPDHEHLRP